MEMGIRAPEQIMFPHSAEGNRSLWKTGGNIKMLESVALKPFFCSPVSHPTSLASSAGPSAATAPCAQSPHKPSRGYVATSFWQNTSPCSAKGFHFLLFRCPRFLASFLTCFEVFFSKWQLERSSFSLFVSFSETGIML